VYQNFRRQVYAADTMLVQENEITVQQLIQMLAKRADNLD
jgi:hypothetical protein